jgi:hypothetical protein
LTNALYKAAQQFNFNKIALLLGQGVEDERAFLSDLDDLLSDENVDAPKIKAKFKRAGRPCGSNNQALFELYELLLQKGHSIPDSSTRKCVARVVAGADPVHYERAVALMKICIQQDMLSWGSSEWAKEVVAERPSAGQGMLSLGPNSNSLFAEAFGAAASAGNAGMLRLLNENIPDTLKEHRCVWVDISLPTNKAAQGGHIDCLEYLFDIMPESQWKKHNSYTSAYTPPITLAALNGHKPAVEWLFGRGADIHEIGSREDEGGILVRTLDHCKDETMVPFLISLGANPNLETKGPNALHMAIWRDREKSIPVLLEHGCSIDYRDQGQRTPFILAAQVGNAAAAKMFLDAGAELEAQDCQGKTAMNWACSNDRLDVFHLLRERHAAMDTPDQKRQTPFDNAKGSVKAWVEAGHYDAHTAPAPNSTGRGPRF